MTTRRLHRNQTAIRIRVIEVTSNIVLGAITGVLVAWLGIQLITGCGETTRTINGDYIKGECVLVPWVKP